MLAPGVIPGVIAHTPQHIQLVQVLMSIIGIIQDINCDCIL